MTAAPLSAWALSHGATLTHCCLRDGGVYATAPLTPRDTPAVITLPRNLALTAPTARTRAEVGAALAAIRTAHGGAAAPSDELAILLLMAHERSLAAQSAWCAYLDALPTTPPGLCNTMAVDNATLSDLCAGMPSLRCRAMDTRGVLSRAVDRACCVVNAPWCTPPLLHWAYGMLASRAMRIPASQRTAALSGGFSAALSPSFESAMVPLMDSCNHRPGALACFATPLRDQRGGTAGTGVAAVFGPLCEEGWAGTAVGAPLLSSLHVIQGQGVAATTPTPEVIRLLPGSTLKAGDQLCINYGSLDNAPLLLNYGFALLMNRLDGVEVGMRRCDPVQTANPSIMAGAVLFLPCGCEGCGGDCMGSGGGGDGSTECDCLRPGAASTADRGSSSSARSDAGGAQQAGPLSYPLIPTTSGRRPPRVRLDRLSPRPFSVDLLTVALEFLLPSVEEGGSDVTAPSSARNSTSLDAQPSGGSSGGGGSDSISSLSMYLDDGEDDDTDATVAALTRRFGVEAVGATAHWLRGELSRLSALIASAGVAAAGGDPRTRCGKDSESISLSSANTPAGDCAATRATLRAATAVYRESLVSLLDAHAAGLNRTAGRAS